MEVLTNQPCTLTTEKSLTLKKELVICLLLSVVFGIFVCTASNRVLNRQDHRSESVEMEHNILRGQPFHHGQKLIYVAAWQNRILFPVLLELGSRLGVLTQNGWYLLIRLLISIAMFTSFWFVLRSDAQAEIKLACAGLLLLAYNLVITFMSATEMTSDFPEAIFAAFFIAATLRRKRLLLLALSIIAAANRESAAFAGVIWFFLYAIDERRKINWREVVYAALVSICSYGTAITLRYAFGGAQAVKSKTQILMLKGNYDSIKDFLLHPTPFSWVGLIFCFLVPDLLWIAANRKSLTVVHKRLMISAGVVAFISLFFGSPAEPRIFITSMVLLIFVGVSSEMNRKTSCEDEYDLALGQFSSGD